MTYQELKKLWLSYLAGKGHAIIPSASIVPENDPSTLFTVAGMQPLVPFLLGQKHPAGVRIANIQRCIRTNDIDEVGDDSHCTFFEMMGNWSLGDYFKKEKIAWSFEFLTSPKYLGIPVEKLHVTCFDGKDDNGREIAPRDTECAQFWEAQGVARDRIHFLPKSENWWAMGSGLGPQGPCSEMFFKSECKCDAKCKCNPAKNCGCFTELGNDVYMQYTAKEVGKIEPAKQRNVDTGWGLERILCFVNGYKSVYESEIFAPAIKLLGGDGRHARIIAEHTRAASMIVADGVIPSNTGAGYVLRRLIRRAVRTANANKIDGSIYEKLIKFYNTYLEFDAKTVIEVFTKEVNRFEQTLAKGLKEFEKVKGKLDGATAFHLYETYGFPIELTQEIATERGIKIDMDGFKVAQAEHSKASKAASAEAGAFKGGLADSGVETVRLHTAAHILLATLRKNFGADIIQKGANITPERLRFDFSLNRKLEPDEIEKVEKDVNQIIARKLDVIVKEMPLADARKIGATGTFSDRYGDVVKVYTIGDVSCEICGGPHVSNTKELGHFKIQKEESCGAGIRRIKAVLE
ncbi:MAG: alanine--tRNA ligase [Christensenellaceae bacterium]|jgi:alanyl-tRNA synthetase|nr:alanine--tRNA ligase [Christensenellaceae bacterium]